jgi:hypothetical protein
MKVFFVNVKSIYEMIVKRVIEDAIGKGQINQDNVFVGEYPTKDDIINFLNSFINSIQKESNGQILSFYFIDEKFNPCPIYLNNEQIVFDYGKTLKRLKSALKFRIKTSDFYSISCKIVSQDEVRNISANIGKSNSILFDE